MPDINITEQSYALSECHHKNSSDYCTRNATITTVNNQ